MLKKIECYIQPFKLDPLTRALVDLGVEGMSVTEVRGFGRQRGFASEDERKTNRDGAKEEIKFLPKLKLEIVLLEEMVDRAVGLIMKLARTGSVGAGKIFIVPVEDAARIGTGEVGYAAII